MKLTRLAIENYQFTIVMVIILSFFGIKSFLTMPRTEDPPVMMPISNVIVVYPGVTPKDLEKLVADPIEDAMNELEDIKEISSTIEDGLVVVKVEFISGSDPDDKNEKVNQKLSRIRGELPQDIYALQTRKYATSDTNILQIAIVSKEVTFREMDYHADRLKKELKKVNGVRDVAIWGLPKQEVRISLDTEKIAQLKIPLKRIMGIVKGSSANIPAGHIDIGSKRYNIQTSGDFQSLDDIRDTVIHSNGQELVYLKNIAKVEMDYEDQNYFTRFNRKRCIFITVNQKESANIFKVMKHLKSKIVQFNKTLPKDIELHYVFDQTVSVEERINGFFSNLFQGVIIVGGFILLAVGFRASIIVMLLIPLSFIIGIAFVDLSGFGLHQITIIGLIVSLGLLVDNAIVVIENITRFLEMGYSAMEAAIKGTTQIAMPIASSTLTTIMAFIPIMMMQDANGEFIRAMPVSVIFTLTVSLFLALTLSPLLAKVFLKIDPKGKKPIVERAGTFIIQKPYRMLLNLVLEYPKLTLLTIVLVFTASLFLIPKIGVSFFPKAEKPQLIININTPQGSSIAKTDRVVRYVENLLVNDDEVKHFATNVGRDNPRIYYNVLPKMETNTRAQIFVMLKNNDKIVRQKLIQSLRKEFFDYPNARIAVNEFEQGPPVNAAVEIRLIGPNLSVLKQIATDVEDMLTSIKGTLNIDNPLRTTKTDLRVNINRAKAGIFGVNLIDIDRTVRMGMSGVPIGKYRDDNGNELNIVARLPKEEKEPIKALEKMFVASILDEQIPLKQLASLEMETGPTRIDHFNLHRTVILTCDVYDNDKADVITKKMIAKLKDYHWPEGYKYSVGGILETRLAAFAGMERAAIIAVISIFGVLVFQFRSFLQPLIIFAAIPLALIGSILGLFFSGFTFSFTAFIGLTSLIGIVINDSIILVDYANIMRKEGKSLNDSVKISGETRFVPVILTSLTTIGGLLPLTLKGGTLWSPMGWTIIGGLVASTFLILVIVPVLYKIMTPEN